jgi:hypothetical protein
MYDEDGEGEISTAAVERCKADPSVKPSIYLKKFPIVYLQKFTSETIL